jgi:hypothetical protein
MSRGIDCWYFQNQPLYKSVSVQVVIVERKGNQSRSELVAALFIFFLVSQSNKSGMGQEHSI